MRTLLQDLGYGLRQLKRSPGFAMVAILTLALGIGANTAIFTLVHAILLQSLPVKNPGQIYRLGNPKSVNCCVIGGLQDTWDNFSYALYQHIRQQTPEFSEMVAFQSGSPVRSVRRSGDNAPPLPLQGEFVEGNYFSFLGVPAYRGRTLTRDDDRAGAAPVAVMSYRTWQNEYGSDPSIVGSSLLVDGTAVSVVGITPPSFYGDRLSDNPPDLFLPLGLEPLINGKTSLLNHPDLHMLYIMGRLKPGFSPEQVQAKVSGELQQWLNSGEGASTVEGQNRSDIGKQKTLLVPAAGGINDLATDAKSGLQLLMAVSLLVLLIACANIANLLLARGSARKMQTSVRLALGARRGRLVRQLLTESVLLSVLGGVAGIFVAFFVTRLILATAFHGSPVLPISPEPSLPVLAFSFGLSLLTGIVFGVAPAWISSHADPVEALHGAGRATTHGATFLQKSLVVGQAALSLALVAGSVLLTQSLRNLEHQNFGFLSDHRYVIRVEHAFQNDPREKLPADYRELQARLNRIPGVLSSSYSMYSPLGNDNWSSYISIDGQPPSTGKNRPESSWLRVSPGYFETLGIRLVKGRVIDERDTPTATHVAVVNEMFVRKNLKPGEDPLGKHFGFGAEHAQDFEIVGVVEDTKYQDTHGPAYRTFYLPYLQWRQVKDPNDMGGEIQSQRIASIQLHVAGHPSNLEATVRRELAELDPDLTIVRMVTLDEQVSEHFNQERLLSRLTLLFALLALTLAAIGLYGVTAYSVERRTREIGIRVAVGATPANVTRLVLRGAFLQVLIGLAIGIPLALLGGRLMSSSLFGVKGYNPVALLVSAALLAVCAFIAGFVPARRAATVDPVKALRVE